MEICAWGQVGRGRKHGRVHQKELIAPQVEGCLLRVGGAEYVVGVISSWRGAFFSRTTECG